MSKGYADSVIKAAFDNPEASLVSHVPRTDSPAQLRTVFRYDPSTLTLLTEDQLGELVAGLERRIGIVSDRVSSGHVSRISELTTIDK